MPTIKKNKKPWMPEQVSGFNKPHDKSDDRYHTQRWRNYRKTFLKKNPLCTECKRMGRITPATHVDHINPISKDSTDNNFWNPDNHQALCRSCNMSKAARERGGVGGK